MPPEDRAGNPSRKPDDFLASLGMSEEEQSGIVQRAQKKVPSYTWGPNQFDRTPCRDCSGSLRVHDDTCPNNKPSITAVTDPETDQANEEKRFSDLYTDEGQGEAQDA
jgi:hypothetical protein